MREIRRTPPLALVGLAFSLARPSKLHADGCTADTSGLAFGSYSMFNTSPLDTMGTITINCTGSFGPTVRVKISGGLSSSFTPRVLRSGLHSLNYNLFLDASCTTIWGDGTPPTSYSTQTPASSINLPLTVYGRIPARQTVWAGSYSDTLVVTVEF